MSSPFLSVRKATELLENPEQHGRPKKAKREYTYVAMSEVYKGTEIVISVTRTGEKNWTSRAEYAVPGKAGVRLEPEATYATEEEARRAALQAAIESIDRARVSRGKY